jgi:hypothetical protein
VRWPWQRHRDEGARAAMESADAAVAEETARLAEVSKVVASLSAHRQRNSFAEAMREAFGAGP